MSWLLLSSKEPKTFDKPLSFVFSSQYGDVLSGLKTEGLINRSHSMAEGSLQSKVEHLPPFPTAQVLGAAVRLMHKQTGVCRCGSVGKLSNHRTNFLVCGRKMPENCRCVKHVNEILEISARSSLDRGYDIPTATSTSRLSFVYTGGDLSDFRTGCKEQWEGEKIKWLVLYTLPPVAPGEQGKSSHFLFTLPTTVIYLMTFTQWQ